MKKFLAKLLTVALVASMSTVAVTAFTNDYPASSKSEGIAAPTDGVIMTGELIGAEGGWEGNVDTGRAAAFDGYLDTFYDPFAASDPEAFAGVKMPEAYILTEIRICPRSSYINRFNGAAIWGFNGDTFDPSTATLIWESDMAADEPVFQVIKANQFIAGANTGFTSYIYWNEVEHGDVAEVELYGNPVNAAAAPAAADPAPAAEEAAAPVEAATPAEAAAPVVEAAAPVAPAQTATTPAPKTSDMGIILSLAVLISTAFVTVKLTKAKNRA